MSIMNNASFRPSVDSAMLHWTSTSLFACDSTYWLCSCRPDLLHIVAWLRILGALTFHPRHRLLPALPPSSLSTQQSFGPLQACNKPLDFRGVDREFLVQQ